MSYADCFALASAVENRAAVVTGDREFGRVEGRIAVVWV
jgi:predicted nucleic acid-binding protein